MKDLIEVFLLYLRHEHGRSEHTIKNYAARLSQFVAWAAERGLTDWPNITREVLWEFLHAEQQRTSAENTHGHVAALKSFYRFAEEEIGLVDAAEHFSLPRTWKRIPKVLIALFDGDGPLAFAHGGSSVSKPSGRKATLCDL